MLSGVNGVEVLSRGEVDPSRSTRIDPLRLTLRVTGLGLTGFEVANLLEHGEHQVITELATAQTVVCAFGPGSSESDAEALVSALTAIKSDRGLLPSGRSSRSDRGETTPEPLERLPAGSDMLGRRAGHSSPAMLPREAFFSNTVRCGFKSLRGS